MSLQFIPWVTVAKVMGLYLMVLGHMSLVDKDWGAFIYTFHMPLFFILSGMLTKDGTSCLDLARKLFSTLIIPYLIIATIWCFIYLCLYVKNGIYDIEYWCVHFCGTFVSPGKSLGSLRSLVHPIWFLLALTEIKMVNSCIKKQSVLITVSLLCVFVILLLSRLSLTLPFAIDSAILAFPFFTIGKLMKKHLPSDLKQSVKYLIYILLTMVGTYLIFRLNGIVDINKCLYGENILLFYLGGVMGSVCIFLISQLLSLLYEGQGVIHTIVQGATIIIGFSAHLSSSIRALLPFLGTSNWGGMLIAALTIAFLYPFIILSQRFFPVILDRKSQKLSTD